MEFIFSPEYAHVVDNKAISTGKNNLNEEASFMILTLQFL